MRGSVLTILALSLALGAACKPKEFICARDEECVASSGGHGRCVLTHCAYSDPACASTLRFDQTAGDDADECVDPAYLVADAGAPDAEPVDAGAADGPTDAAGLVDGPTDAAGLDVAVPDASLDAS
jgi:hypothetical protein